MSVLPMAPSRQACILEVALEEPEMEERRRGLEGKKEGRREKGREGRGRERRGQREGASLLVPWVTTAVCSLLYYKRPTHEP